MQDPQTPRDAVRFSARRRRVGLPVALVTGCFDVIHVGHIALLELAAATCGFVMVGLNSDDSIRKLKGPLRPVNNQRNRMLMMKSLADVTFTFVFNELTVTNTILRYRPTHWFKGGDYTIDTLNKGEVAAARTVGAEIVFAPLVNGMSSSAIIARTAL